LAATLNSCSFWTMAFAFRIDRKTLQWQHLCAFLTCGVCLFKDPPLLLLCPMPPFYPISRGMLARDAVAQLSVPSRCSLHEERVLTIFNRPFSLIKLINYIFNLLIFSACQATSAIACPLAVNQVRAKAPNGAQRNDVEKEFRWMAATKHVNNEYLTMSPLRGTHMDFVSFSTNTANTYQIR
jgi:hypothetical protein